MPRFSAVLSSTDLNDFIVPAQACVSPPVTKTEDKKVSISLKDCLACSGCVTTEELDLIGRQSTDQIMHLLDDRKADIFVTLSPQSIASLAASYGLSWDSMSRSISFFFKNIVKVPRVYDQRLVQVRMLELAVSEFLSFSSSSYPLISSHCPAIHSYLFKKDPEFASAHLSKLKTAQQAIGMILKSSPETSFHISIVPCYDKKLELTNASDTLSYIDCALTTTELDALCRQYDFSFSSTHQSELDAYADLPLVASDMVCMKGHVLEAADRWGSGGFIQSLLLYFHSHEYNVEKVPLKPDLIEWHIKRHDKTWFILLSCFGFKNIQNVIRKVKSGLSLYAYIEMMACSSACINGGGQLAAGSLDSVSELYLQSAVTPTLKNPLDIPYHFQRTPPPLIKKPDQLLAHIKW